MTWSVKERKKECEPDYLFQIFSEKEWEEYPFAGEEKLQWFRDARLGLFFHVGISAVGGVDIGWPRQTHKLRIRDKERCRMRYMTAGPDR